MHAWQKVKIILETDFLTRSLTKVVLLELTAPRLGTAPARMAGAAEESSFPRLNLAAGALSSLPAMHTWGQIF